MSVCGSSGGSGFVSVVTVLKWFCLCGSSRGSGFVSVLTVGEVVLCLSVVTVGEVVLCLSVVTVGEVVLCLWWPCGKWFYQLEW